MKKKFSDNNINDTHENLDIKNINNPNNIGKINKINNINNNNNITYTSSTENDLIKSEFVFSPVFSKRG